MKPDSIDTPPIDPSAAPTTNNRKLQQFLPADWNWRSYGKVTPVRNQGPCGCCWAFAATSAMESLYLIRNGGDPNGLHLSEQQLISCIYSNGCNGELLWLAVTLSTLQGASSTALVARLL